MGGGRYSGPERRRPGRPWAKRSSQGAVPGAIVSTGSDSRAKPARKAFHVLLGLAAWAAFLSLWVWQIRDYLPAHWIGGLTMIGVGALVFATLTPLWVRWNRNIYRRRHSRRSPIVHHVAFETDRLGRDLVISPEVHLNPTRITVDLDQTTGTKRYHAPDHEASSITRETGDVA